MPRETVRCSGRRMTASRCDTRSKPVGKSAGPAFRMRAVDRPHQPKLWAVPPSHTVTPVFSLLSLVSSRAYGNVRGLFLCLTGHSPYTVRYALTGVSHTDSRFGPH